LDFGTAQENPKAVTSDRTPGSAICAPAGAICWQVSF
jgi:hypothetical protein